MNPLHTHLPEESLWGHVVAWEISAREIPIDTLKSALRDAGLSDAAAVDLRPTTALRRALADYRKERAIDKVSRDETYVTFQLTRKTLQDSRIDYGEEDIVKMDLNTGSISCEDTAIREHVCAMFAHAKDHRNTSDITRLVQRMFACNADLCPIVPSKGVAYFVPVEHADFCSQMDTFLHSIGGNMHRMPVPKGTPEGDRAVKESIETRLDTLTRELREAIDGWDDSTRRDTMERAAERWKILSHKTEAYAEYLGDRQSRLIEELAKAKAALVKKIMRKDTSGKPLLAACSQ